MFVRSALRSLLRGTTRGAPLAALLVVLVGCGGSTSTTRRPAARPETALRTPDRGPKAPAGPPLLPAHVVAQLDDEEVAPYFTRRGDEALLFWAAGGKWWSRRLAADGAPLAPTLDIGPAVGEVPVASLRPTASGYIAVWIEDQGGSRAIRTLTLDPAGKPTGAPVLVLQSADEIAWVDVLVSAQSTTVIWEIPRDEGSDVLTASLASGKASAPIVVAREILAWQAAASDKGAAVGIVRRAGPKPAAPDADPIPKLGQVALLELNAAGKPGAPVIISSEASAQIDLEVVFLDGKYLLAWSDERDLDATVFVAVVEPGGRIAVPPRRATAPAGEQALVSLIAPGYVPGAAGAPAGASGKRALLAWEDLIRAPREARLIHLASIGSDGVIGKDQAGLMMSASGPPDLTLDGDGFAALTLAPASGPAGTVPEGDAELPIWPTYVRFGPDLSVRAGEPVRAAPFTATGGIPYLVRGLSCARGQCTALASAASTEPASPAPAAKGDAKGATAGRSGTSSAKPSAAPAAPPAGDAASAPLAVVSLPVREGPWRAPALRETGDQIPRATAVRALYDGDHVSEVTAANLGGGRALAAWITYHLDGASTEPRGARGARGADTKDQGATLAVRTVRPDALGKLTVLSQKASSLGGVALASAPGDNPDSVLAWVAREKGEPQVYVTRLDANGEKVTQKKVTSAQRRKGQGGATSEATDVAIAHDGQDGWIVAWIDTRDGNAEVYAARLDKNLQKSGPDQRITSAPGDAAEVQIQVRGKEAWLVWSDARQDSDTADIWMARLDAKTLKKAAPETRLFTSPEHSRSPSLAPSGAGMLAAWIEEPAGEGATGAGSARIVQLDERGMMQGAPAPLGPQGTTAASVALTCDTACRAVLTISENDVLSLRGLELTPEGRPGEAKLLGVLTGNSAQDVSPIFAGPGALFFSDDAISGSGRVRWMSVAWKR
ncbi:TolB family protein [Chondromyces apiculatus]|nr:hypothetical protein [Chondromyces apiculatus]